MLAQAVSYVIALLLDIRSVGWKTFIQEERKREGLIVACRQDYCGVGRVTEVREILFGGLMGPATGDQEIRFGVPTGLLIVVREILFGGLMGPATGDQEIRFGVPTGLLIVVREIRSMVLMEQFAGKSALQLTVFDNW